jgi:hypothetical protein
MSEISTRILALDKWFAGSQARPCPKNAAHGRVTVHGSGTAVICGVCAYAEPLSESEIAEAVEATNAWRAH